MRWYTALVDEERAPLTGSWPRLYALVLGALAFWILLFAWFTERYQPGS